MEIYVEKTGDKKMKRVRKDDRLVVESKTGASMNIFDIEEQESEVIEFMINGALYKFASFEELEQVLEGSKQAKIVR